jgi:hypothetical protein
VIKLRRISWAGDVTRMGKMKRDYILLGTFDENRLLGEPRDRWEVSVQKYPK